MKTVIDISDGYKRTKIGIIPNEWEVLKLKDVAKIGSGTTPSTIVKEYWNGNVPWLPTGKVNDRIIISADTFITEKAVKEKSIQLLPIDSVVIAMIGQGQTRGRAALLKISAWVNQNFAYLIPTSKVESTFLFYLLEYNYHRIRYEGNRGGSQGSLNTGMVKSLFFAFPKKSEQQKIAEILSTWDEAIQKCEQTITQLIDRNKELAVQLLLGNKRIKGFETSWKNYPFEKVLKKVKRPVNWRDDELYNLISVRRRSGGIFYRDALYGHQIKVKNLYSVKSGDFLFSKMQIVHGASALVTDEFNDSKISGSYIAVRAKDESLLNLNFLNWYSKTSKFYHQTFISSYGVHIEKMTFDFELFLSETIKLPSLEEQTAIANVLEQADKELKLSENKLLNLKEQKKGLMQKLLTGEIRVNVK